MPTAPVITFPGVVAVQSASISRTHGISPSAITLTIAPQPGLIAQVGDLTITVDGRTLVVPDCLVDSASFQFDTRRRLVSLVLFDRRWRWRYGSISGYYNRTNANGGIIEPIGQDPPGGVTDTGRTDKELASLLLNAMGEREYDVTALQDTLNTYGAEWDCSNPAFELADLCDVNGCRVNLRWDNRVEIVKMGSGAKLPIATIVSTSPHPAIPGVNFPVSLPIVRVAQSIDARSRPDTIMVCTAPIKFQVDMELEAVGVDIDGSIRLIKNLSFAPDPLDENGGFDDFFCGPKLGFHTLEDDDVRTLADASVYRLYRIKIPFTFPARGSADEELVIDNIERIRPIFPYQLGVVNEDGVEKNRPAVVYGRWYNADIFDNTVGKLAPLAEPSTNEEKLDLVKFDRTVVPGGYQLDTDNCLIVFSKPIVSERIVGLSFGPAALYIRCCFYYRENNGSWRKYFRTRRQPLPHLGTEPRVIRDESLHPIAKVEYRKRNPNLLDESLLSFQDYEVVTNYASIDRSADSAINSAEREYSTNMPLMIEYAGFFPIDLDGAIRSIEFNLDSQGVSAITTRVHRDQDVPTRTMPSYGAMRNAETVSSFRASYLRTSEQQIADRIRRSRRR